jgi:hypothetical protein
MRLAQFLLLTASLLLVSTTQAWAAYVDAKGRVAYEKLRKNKKDSARLDAYLEAVAGAKDPGKGDAALAFFLNAYNATVIDEVLERWPVESVMKEEKFFKTKEHVIAGEKMSLDALEHKLIRPRFEDARVHFVLVCAAKSCPRLRRSAMTAADVDKQLEASAKEFIPRVTKAGSGEKVVTSKLFEWFAKDFEREAGSVSKYLAKYLDGALAKKLAKGSVELTYRKYDWALNDQ